MTSIEWTHGKGYKGETWNPTVGCSKVSPGCAHCYAETLHRTRLDGKGAYPEFRPWTPENAEHNVTLVPERLEQPLRWRAPRMVFVNSMSDLFHELVPVDFIAAVFQVMHECPQHVFQVLTKRPERMAGVVERISLRGEGPDGRAYYWDPSPNIWLGTSIENRRYVGRADALRATPAAVRFISAEPLIGPLVYRGGAFFARGTDGAYHYDWGDGYVGDDLDLDGIDWLIVGGESGPKHRRLDHQWIRDLRDACRAAGTAFFVKQMGGHRPGDRLEDLPEEFRIREWPRPREVQTNA